MLGRDLPTTGFYLVKTKIHAKCKIPSPQAGAVLAVNLHIDSGHTAHHGDGLHTCTHMSLVSSGTFCRIKKLRIRIRMFFCLPDTLVKCTDPAQDPSFSHKGVKLTKIMLAK
jgi:hypothetical protein